MWRGKKMNEPSTWRELLRQLIRDPREKQRIATELGINAATLVRWVHNETDPRPQNLRELLRASVRYRAKMRESRALEVPEVSAGARPACPAAPAALQRRPAAPQARAALPAGPAPTVP